jgi:hypothetical protein
VNSASTGAAARITRSPSRSRDAPLARRTARGGERRAAFELCEERRRTQSFEVAAGFVDQVIGPLVG